MGSKGLSPLAGSGAAPRLNSYIPHPVKKTARHQKTKNKIKFKNSPFFGVFPKIILYFLPYDKIALLDQRKKIAYERELQQPSCSCMKVHVALFTLSLKATQ